MILRRALAATVCTFAVGLASPAAAQDLSSPASAHQADLAAPYVEGANAAAELRAALAALAEDAARAETAGDPAPRLLAIFGANWCHDSLALARMLNEGEAARLVRRQFRVVYIDAGVPQTGQGRNLDLAARYGVSDISGTPTMLVLDAQGRLLNTPDDARSWRNAESRGPRAVRRFLREMAKPARG